MAISVGIVMILAWAHSPLPAQREAVLPAGYERTWSGAPASGAGLAVYNAGIMQALYERPFNGAYSLVYGLSFRRAGTMFDYTPFTADVEILVCDSTLDFTSLSTSFATNLSAGGLTTFPRQVISVPATLANSSPDQWIDFPSAVPWISSGPNMLVQVKVFSKTYSGSGFQFKMDRTFRMPAYGTSREYGKGCGGAQIAVSSPGGYLPGTGLWCDLLQAPPGQAALLMIGTDLAYLGGGLPLPLDLGYLGMPGCHLLLSPKISLSTTVGTSGSAVFHLPIPNDPSLSQVGLGMQWLYTDPGLANPVGAALTAGVLVRFGPILPTNSYVWHLSDVYSPTGTTQEGGPIMRVTVFP